MTVEIKRLTDRDDWNTLVSRSHQATPFHRHECLTVSQTHSETVLHPLIGMKGQEPVGLFPVFEWSKGPVSAVFSPAPDLKIPYLGPALITPNGMKRRKRELWNREFIEGVLDRISTKIDPVYANLRTSPSFTDERPFLWDDYVGTPRYTYFVDLTIDGEDLLESFSKDARRNVQIDDESIQLVEGGADDVEPVIESVRERHREQGKAFPFEGSFVRDLYSSLPDDTIRVYLCHENGTFRGGQITVETDGTVFGWLTAVDLSCDIPVNDLLNWYVMQEAKRNENSTYDLVGANKPRLSKYKSKFGPDLQRYMEVTASTVGGSFASSLYRMLRSG